MPSDRPVPGRTPRRHALLCLLLLALLLHGQAAVLRQLLGAAHWHHQAQPADSGAQPGWLDRLQAWRQQLQARSPLVAAHAGGHADTGHHHAGSERHHHHGQDRTVVALEPGGSGAGALADTLAGSLLQPLGLAAPLCWAGHAPRALAWPHAPAAAWCDAGRRLPERPPRA
ncbi:MAG: hypothetical protein V4795_04190 [Pseudomonadota bacterium]